MCDAQVLFQNDKEIIAEEALLASVGHQISILPALAYTAVTYSSRPTNTQ